MRKILTLLLSMLIASALVLAGCGDNDSSKKESAPDPTQEVLDDTTQSTPDSEVEIALQITGRVANEMVWSEDEVRAMETMDAESTNAQGATETYTGVSLNALLELAGPATDATTLTLVGETEAEVALAEITECANCILSFRNQGGFSAVLPGFAKDAQVKGVTEVIVK